MAHDVEITMNGHSGALAVTVDGTLLPVTAFELSMPTVTMVRANVSVALGGNRRAVLKGRFVFDEVEYQEPEEVKRRLEEVLNNPHVQSIQSLVKQGLAEASNGNA